MQEFTGLSEMGETLPGDKIQRERGSFCCWVCGELDGISIFLLHDEEERERRDWEREKLVLSGLRGGVTKEQHQWRPRFNGGWRPRRS